MPNKIQRHHIVEQIVEAGSVAIIRLDEVENLMQVVEALRAGGVTTFEITMTTPRALSLIEEVARRTGDDDGLLLGVGSVLDADTVSSAVDAGARFVVSPVFKRELIEAAHGLDVPVVPGALSPTEIQTAHEAGADLIKVFPANLVGASYFKDVLAPLPHLKLMPTGGVTPANAGDWVQAGAQVVGLGSALVDKEAIAAGDFARLTRKGQHLCQRIAAARNSAE